MTRVVDVLRRGAAAVLAVSGASAFGAVRCDVEWHLTPHLDMSPRYVEAELAFDARGRTQTELVLPGPWAGVKDFAAQIGDLRPGAAHQQLSDGKSAQRKLLTHRAAERVRLHYRVGTSFVPVEGVVTDHLNAYRTQLGADWFQFFGHSVLIAVDELDDDPRAHACVTVVRPKSGDALVSSFGASPSADGASAQTWALSGEPGRMRHAVYAGGKVALRERNVAGRPVWIAVRGAWTNLTPDRFADATVAVLAAHRRFWGDFDQPYQLVLLEPNFAPKGMARSGGSAVYQAFVMNAALDFDVPSETFDHLIGHEDLHTWIPQRFGRLGAGEAGQGQELHYWFSEGFTDYYAHRLLLRAGVWALGDYANRLNRKIADYLLSPVRNEDNQRVAAEFFTSPTIGKLPYQRGEWLAFHWDAALRARGKPGLDAVMKHLMLPRGAPQPKPLATDRLLDALARALGDSPAQDVARIVERGETFAFEAGTLGPCFAMQREAQPFWQLGFDRETFRTKRFVGVDPTGPAHAAGLREGDQLVEAVVSVGDMDTPVALKIKNADGSIRSLSYRAISTERRELPVYRPRDAAEQNAECRAWLGR